jgi:membrane-associated phospholipid phosphatase
MLTKVEYIKILMFIFVIGFIIAIQTLVAEYLEDISVPIIKSLQDDEYLVTCMRLITKLGSKKVKTLLLAIIFSLCNHYHSFLYATIAYSSMFICGVLKINFQQPRPFWISDEVKALSCEYGYGYPSNHVITTVPAFLIFYEIIFYRFEVDKKVNGRIYQVIGFSTVLFLTIIIGFSRMILGVHSLDQVVFGLIMGFALYYFYLHIIDLDLRNPIPYFRILYNPYYFYRVVLVLACFLFAFMINIIVLNGDEYYETVWTERMVRQCGYYPYITPFFKCLVDTFDVFVFVGILAGMLFDINIIKKYDSLDDFIYDYISYDKHSRVGKWNHTGLMSFLIRLFLSYIQCLIIFNLFGLISAVLFEDGLVTQLIMGKAVPMFLLGFFMFAFYRKEFEYLHITNRSNYYYLNDR